MGTGGVNFPYSVSTVIPPQALRGWGSGSGGDGSDLVELKSESETKLRGMCSGRTGLECWSR